MTRAAVEVFAVVGGGSRLGRLEIIEANDTRADRLGRFFAETL